MSNLFSIFDWTNFKKSVIISEIKSGNHDLNMVDETGKTILMYATLMWEYDTNDIVSTLIEMNADINIQDHVENNTAMHYAIKNGKKTIVNLLLRAGANIHLQNKSQETPIFYACDPNFGINSQEILLSLIKYGASIHDKNSFNETPLLKASKKQQASISWLFIIQLLLYTGSDIHACTIDNKTIFDIADNKIQQLITDYIYQQSYLTEI